MKVAIIALSGLLLFGCAGQAVIQPTPEIIVKTVEIPGPTVTIEKTPPVCIDALNAADAVNQHTLDWLNAMIDEDYTKASKLSDQADNLLKTYNDYAEQCRRLLDVPLPQG